MQCLHKPAAKVIYLFVFSSLLLQIRGGKKNERYLLSGNFSQLAQSELHAFCIRQNKVRPVNSNCVVKRSKRATCSEHKMFAC